MIAFGCRLSWDSSMEYVPNAPAATAPNPPTIAKGPSIKAARASPVFKSYISTHLSKGQSCLGTSVSSTSQYFKTSLKQMSNKPASSIHNPTI